MFTVSGKSYTSVSQLTCRKTGEYQSKLQHASMPVYEDVHGRPVIALSERFPCFDSYDYLYENRYYRWYYIKDGSRISVVYTEDKRPGIWTCDDLRTEDAKACEIRTNHYDELKACNFL